MSLRPNGYRPRLIEKEIMDSLEAFGAVVEMPDGRWGAFEIRLGGNQVDDAAKSLIRMSEKMNAKGNGPSTLCVICGLMDRTYRREDGVYVMPITSLRP